MGNPRSPEDCDRLLGEYLADGRLEAIADLYEPSASLVTQTGETRVGRDAIRAAFVEFAAAHPRLRENIVQVLRNGDDLAVVYNDWTMTASAADGQPVEVHGKAIEVVRRQADGTWRFAVDDPWGRSQR